MIAVSLPPIPSVHRKECYRRAVRYANVAAWQAEAERTRSKDALLLHSGTHPPLLIKVDSFDSVRRQTSLVNFRVLVLLLTLPCCVTAHSKTSTRGTRTHEHTNTQSTQHVRAFTRPS